MKRIAALFVMIMMFAANPGTPNFGKPSENKLPDMIVSAYREIGIRVNPEVVRTIMNTASIELPVYFPNGEIDVSHILAICAVESYFYPKAQGKAGEKGLFQILLPDEALDAIGAPDADPFNVSVNTRMGIYVLRTKFEKYGSRPKAIIAYNGVVRRRDGSWNDQYLLKFRKQHARIVGLIERSKTQNDI